MPHTDEISGLAHRFARGKHRASFEPDAKERPYWKKENMEQEKLRQIEAKWREILVAENRPRKENPQVTSKPVGVRVIRRRKGAPDKQII